MRNRREGGGESQGELRAVGLSSSRSVSRFSLVILKRAATPDRAHLRPLSRDSGLKDRSHTPRGAARRVFSPLLLPSFLSPPSFPVSTIQLPTCDRPSPTRTFHEPKDRWRTACSGRAISTRESISHPSLPDTSLLARAIQLTRVLIWGFETSRVSVRRTKHKREARASPSEGAQASRRR